MKPLNYDLKVVDIIKALRQSNNIKQMNFACDLNIDQSTYCRVEKGELALSSAQVKIAAHICKTNHIQVLTLADSECDKENFLGTSFSELLIRFTLMYEGKGSHVNFTEEEMEFVISMIRKKYKEIFIDKLIFNQR